MKTSNQNQATAINTLRNISAALFHAGDKTSSDAINAQLSKIESERAALVAVAEAAKLELAERLQKSKLASETDGAWEALAAALANLAAVRGEIESDDTVNRDNAVQYIERVGIQAARMIKESLSAIPAN